MLRGSFGFFLMLGCLITVIAGPVIVMVVRALVLEHRGAKRKAGLMATGVAAQARVLRLAHGSVAATGPAGSQPIRIDLEIMLPTPPHGARPVHVVIDDWVPRYAVGGVQPGAVLLVRVDPQDPNHVAIDFAGMGYG
jgi:hypothetical protein